ncbi:MAG: phytanoyl-CoA dioxygenase family protein [Azospirillaceae bacterium]|nr:phytanoyl-CoA dioxygenase family protein [Azospirillaceae bacterium]
MTLSDGELQDIIERYNCDGFAILRGVLDADLIDEACRHVAWLCEQYPDLRPEHLHHPLMRDDAFWVRLVTDARLLNIARAVLGPDLACFTAHYICKPAHDGHAVLWHQDGAYWNLEPMNALTLWVAIDRSGPDNGCLRMLPGTHRQPLLPILPRNDVPNMLASSMDVGAFDLANAVEIHLEPGDVSIHHSHIVHGSEANTSAYRRCGLDIGYIPTSTMISNEALYLDPILACGRPGPSQRYRPWPGFDEGKTIAFRGHETWNERAARHNAGFEPVAHRDEDPLHMTYRMMRRLTEGTVKTIPAE